MARTPDPIQTGTCVAQKCDAALLPRCEIPRQLCNLTFSNNIRLMRRIMHDASFEQLLEQARNEKNLQSIRTYLHLYSEYHTYLTREQKGKLLAFLYELLMHHDGDVRHRAARIMGQILSNSGPKYRKELPVGVGEEASAPNLLSFLNESLQVWAQYVEDCLHPDQKITPKHALRISNSLKIIAESVFQSLSRDKWPEHLQGAARAGPKGDSRRRFILMDTMNHLPADAFSRPRHWNCCICLPKISRLSGKGEDRRAALFPQTPYPRRSGAGRGHFPLLRQSRPGDSLAVAYERDCLTGGGQELLSNAQRQHLYLSNMKMAVHWSVKNHPYRHALPQCTAAAGDWIPYGDASE